MCSDEKIAALIYWFFLILRLVVKPVAADQSFGVKEPRVALGLGFVVGLNIMDFKYVLEAACDLRIGDEARNGTYKDEISLLVPFTINWVLICLMPSPRFPWWEVNTRMSPQVFGRLA